jgi:hypothetical protein
MVVLGAGCHFIAKIWWIFASGFGLSWLEEILLTLLYRFDELDERLVYC